MSAGTVDFVVRVDKKLCVDLDCLRIACLSLAHRIVPSIAKTFNKNVTCNHKPTL